MTVQIAVEPKKRGRKPGQVVRSKDFQTFLALQDIDFAAYAKRKDVGTRAWDIEIVTAIIDCLRDMKKADDSAEDDGE